MKSFTIYFSLGEAVAALGLIFAVYQLRRPVWSIVLSIKRKTYLVRLFSALGLISIAISAVLPQIVKRRPTSLVECPLFWEFLGCVFFISAPVALLILAEKKDRLFTKNNAEKFHQVILRNIARATPDILETCINVIGSNLNEITEAISKSKISLHEGKKEKQKPDYSDYARSIFNFILTEPQVLTYVVTSRLDFLSHLLREIKEKHLTSRHGINLMISSITKELFENQDSYLYRELKYSGFGIYKPLFESLFYDQKFLNEFRSLQEWRYRPYELNKEKFNVYIEAFNHALKGYWFDGSYVHHLPFESAFTQLTAGAKALAIEISKLSEDIFWKNPSVNTLFKIASFLGSDFARIYREALKEKKVRDCDLEVRVEGEYKDPASVTAAYSKAVFDFLCALSMAEKHGENLRHFAVEATRPVFGFGGEGFEKMRERFLEHVWENIKENINRGFYPALLRTYLSLMIPSRSTTEEGRKLINFLYKEFKPLVLLDKKMVNGKYMEKVLLPESIIFDREREEFRYKKIDGNLVTMGKK